MDELEDILRNYLNKGSSRIDITAVLSLIKIIKEEQAKQLILSGVVGQIEQLKPMVFELANKLGIAGYGNEAVSMHRIHNRL